LFLGVSVVLQRPCSLTSGGSCLRCLMSPLFSGPLDPSPPSLPLSPTPPYVIHIRMTPAIHVTSGRSITLRVFAAIQQQYLSCNCVNVYESIRLCYARCGWKQVSLDSNRRNVRLRRYNIHTCVHTTLTFDFWPLTLKTSSAMPTHMLNIRGRCHWNPSTK